MGGYSQAQPYKPRGRPSRPGVPCPECEGTATWRKGISRQGKPRVYCCACKIYFHLDLTAYIAPCGGNAAWRALRGDNGTYTEMWGGRKPPNPEQRAELLAICDRMNEQELQERRQAKRDE